MNGRPESLERLLAATPARRDRAWAAFVHEFSDLILFTVRKTERTEDDVSDAYTYVLERLRRDDLRRLRSFAPGGPARFSTWLVVVVRRLVIDHRRSAGRNASPEEGGAPRGEGLVEAVADVTRFADADRLDPLQALQADVLREAVAAAVARLDVSDRLLLTLRFEDGHSAQVIADAMSFPSPFHVYRRIRSVLAMLREMLEADGIRSARG